MNLDLRKIVYDVVTEIHGFYAYIYITHKNDGLKFGNMECKIRLTYFGFHVGIHNSPRLQINGVIEKNVKITL